MQRTRPPYPEEFRREAIRLSQTRRSVSWPTVWRSPTSRCATGSSRRRPPAGSARAAARLFGRHSDHVVRAVPSVEPIVREMHACRAERGLRQLASRCPSWRQRGSCPVALDPNLASRGVGGTNLHLVGPARGASRSVDQPSQAEAGPQGVLDAGCAVEAAHRAGDEADRVSVLASRAVAAAEPSHAEAVLVDPEPEPEGV